MAAPLRPDQTTCRRQDRAQNALQLLFAGESIDQFDQIFDAYESLGHRRYLPLRRCHCAASAIGSMSKAKV